MMTHSLTPVRAQHRLRREEDATLRERELGKEKKLHVSVMSKEALELLDLKKGDVVVDATAGAGGHSEAILKEADVELLSIDADGEAVLNVGTRLKQFKKARVVEGNFRDLEQILHKQGITSIDKALFDLGWNATQLAGGRGFSFLRDEPLSMSYGKTPASGFTASEILNQWEEKVIADVLFGYGEERYARPIAKAIVARREMVPIKTTIELVEIIRDAVPGKYRHGRLHFATRSFQALRIAVNDELGSIDKGLQAAWKHVNPGGRMVVISFHSIEDRAVKRLFAALAKKDGRLLVKKPLVAGHAETLVNASARSAKMRAIEKNN